MRRAVHRLLQWPAATVLLTLLASVAAAGPTASLEVTYVANAGFLIQSGTGKVLVDALFDEGIPPYPTIPDHLRPALENARSPFDDVDLVLATHVHADHFGPRAVARHLRVNPRALFVSTPQAVERLRTLIGGEPAIIDRMRPVWPAEGESLGIVHRGITVEVLNLHHGRERRPPTQNLGFVIQLGGRRILHVGDTEATADDMRPYRLAERGIDVALLPTWLLAHRPWYQAVTEQIRPEHIVVMHLATSEAPASYFSPARDPRSFRSAVHERFPTAVFLTDAGESVAIAPADSKR